MKIIFYTLLIFTTFLCNAQQKIKTDRPNILFILVDDLGYSDVGFMGSKYYEQI